MSFKNNGEIGFEGEIELRLMYWAIELYTHLFIYVVFQVKKYYFDGPKLTSHP